MEQILQQNSRSFRRHSTPVSTVGIVSRLRAEGTVVQIPVEEGSFLSSSNRLDQLSKTLSLLVSGHRGSSPTSKWPGRDTYHSPTSTAEVKNAWIYTCTPPICLHGMVTDNFALFRTRGYSTARIYFQVIP